MKRTAIFPQGRHWYASSSMARDFSKRNSVWTTRSCGCRMYSVILPALPQIMKKCGIDYFMTTKISWNERNKMPYDTFLWEGIDGTEVLTHFIPTRDYGAGAVEDGVETAHFTTYNGYLNSSQTMGGWQRYSQKELNREVLMSYGYGDGGGGVTKDMLENQKRLSRGIPGAPKTVMSTARHFFETLDSHVQEKRNFRAGLRAVSGVSPRHLYLDGKKQKIQPPCRVCM